MTHALIIGGSGMLQGAALDLAKEHTTVSVIGRSLKKLQRLQELSDRINPIQADYTDFQTFIETVERSITERGAISLVVSWIHDTAPDAALALAVRLDTLGIELIITTSLAVTLQLHTEEQPNCETTLQR